MYNLPCKTEFGSDTPKWVFHRGGWNLTPPGHPEISDAGSNRVKETLVNSGQIREILGKISYTKAN